MKNYIGLLGGLFMFVIGMTVAVLNLSSGHWLLGWDNLVWEFDLLLNLKRAFFGVWQEYYGLGLLPGMAQASALPRILLFMVLDVLLPTMWLRWVWVMGMYVLGGVGMYVLGRRLFGKALGIGAALVMGVFYLFNMATVQTFYVPLETFVTFFGFLPWWVYVTYRYLVNRDVSIWKLLVLFFVSSCAFYVQTMFVVWMMVFGVLLATYLIRHKTKEALKRSVLLASIVLFANLYWLMPVGYFTLTNADVTVEAGQNRLATIENELMSKGRGTLQDVALLNGFWMDYPESNVSNDETVYLMENWRVWQEQSWVKVVGLGLFCLSVIGLVYLSFWKRYWWGWGSMGVFFLVLIMLARERLVFDLLFWFLKTNVPLFGQVFRSAFTKWSLVGGFVYAIGLGGFVALVSSKLKRVGMALVVVVGALSVLVVWPVFRGELISDSMKVELPGEYLELFKWFSEEPKQARIAHLPAPYIWGWTHYDWGYRGSGFLWYGIEQPILDRAFDVWSRENETFYREFSTALYGCEIATSQAPRNDTSDDCVEDIERVFDKYDVSYVLLDKSVVLPGSDEELLRYDVTEQIMEEIGAEEVFGKGKLVVWDVRLGSQRSDLSTDGFVYGLNGYRVVEADTTYARKDVVYEDGDYISSNKKSESQTFYPFAGVYAEEPELFIGAEDGKEYVEASEMLEDGAYTLEIPGLTGGFPVQLYGQLVFEDERIVASLGLPYDIRIDGTSVFGDAYEMELSLSVDEDVESAMVEIGGQFVELKRGEVREVDEVRVLVGEPVEMFVYAGELRQLDINPLEGEFYECWKRDEVGGYISAIVQQDVVELTVQDRSACQSVRVGEFDEDGLMSVRLEHRSDSGARPQFCVTKESDEDYECLHEDVFSNESSSEIWSGVERYVPVRPGEVYWLDVAARASDEVSREWEIGYRDAQLSVMDVYGSVNAPASVWEKLMKPTRMDVGGGEMDVRWYSFATETVLTGRNAANCDVFGRGEYEVSERDQFVVYLATNKGSVCESVELKGADTLYEYALAVRGTNVQGRSVKLYVYNQASGRNDIEALADEGDFSHVYGLMSWPSYAPGGYVLNVGTRSFGSEVAENVVERIDVYPVSFGWLSRVRVFGANEEDPSTVLNQSDSRSAQDDTFDLGRLSNVSNVEVSDVRKLGTSHYVAEVSGEGVVVLSQGYSEGWRGYLVEGGCSGLCVLAPWWYGEKLPHVKVNGWANGWEVDDEIRSDHFERSDLSNTVVMVYWPQYLQWGGMAVLLLVFGWFGYVGMRSSKRDAN